MPPTTPRTPRHSTNLNMPSSPLSSSAPGVSTVVTLRAQTTAATSKTLRRVLLSSNIYGLLKLSNLDNLVHLQLESDNGPVHPGIVAVCASATPGVDKDGKSLFMGDAMIELLQATVIAGNHHNVKAEMGAKLRVRKYEGQIGSAKRVHVKLHVGAEHENKASSEDIMTEGWRWYLEHFLLEVKHISPGMKFHASFKQTTKVFTIEGISEVESSSEPGEPASILEEAFEGLSLNEPQIYAVQPDAHVELESPNPTWNEQVEARESKFLVTPFTAVSKISRAEPPRTNPYPFTPATSIGGLNRQLQILRTHLLSSLVHTGYFIQSHLTPPSGILLYGPPGTGKTLLLRAIATESNANCYVIDGSLFGKYMGESENSIRKVFAEAKLAKNGRTQSIVFIDEIDSLAPRRSGVDNASDSRVVTTLLTELDALASAAYDPTLSESGARVLVVAATNRPNSIDPALRRPGRFDREIEIGIPDAKARLEILRVLLRHVPTLFDKEAENGFIEQLASRTHGFVGADLEAVVRGSVMRAVDRLITGDDAGSSSKSSERYFSLVPSGEESKEMMLHQEDVEETLKEIRPTAMREIFLEPPKVRWTDVGGLDDVKQRLREAVEWPLTHPEAFARLGGTPRKGLLLYGPPGCSKTLIAKALATEAGLNFMAVKGPELLSMYVGESERAVREVFRKARAASPSIIFFDEIDALGASRESKEGTGGGHGVGVGVLTALLNEMDGIEELGNVVILAATNRPDMIDHALMRPGRLDTILYVGPPDFEARREILKIKTRKMPLDSDVSIDQLAQQTEGYSGAEIVNICDEAAYHAMRESFDIHSISKRHFDASLSVAVKQITEQMKLKYKSWIVGGVKKI